MQQILNSILGRLSGEGAMVGKWERQTANVSKRLETWAGPCIHWASVLRPSPPLNSRFRWFVKTITESQEHGIW